MSPSSPLLDLSLVHDLVIPPTMAGPLVEEQEPVLLWVHTGTATIDTAGTRHHLAQGEALWVPPGVRHCTQTNGGTVVFPLFLRPAELGGVLAEVHRIVVPPGWEDWLIHRWDDNSYTREPLPGSEALLQLIADAARDHSPPVPHIPRPPLPRSREALDVARWLLRNPRSRHDVASLASRQSISAKTLQRQFVHETGMPLSLWRARTRMEAAATHLAHGNEIGWTAREVGYLTPTGFTKAFRRLTGFTPRDYAQLYQICPDRNSATMEISNAITETPTDRSPCSPRVPARTFWEQVNERHELMWVYRGHVDLRIGTRHWSLDQGQAIWVPAGLTHSIDFAAESIMLSVGTAHGRIRVDLGDLQVMRFPPEAEAFLLHTMISEYTLLRPLVGQGAFIQHLFRHQFLLAQDDDAEPSGAVGDLAQLLRRQPADSRSLAEWATHLGIPAAELGAEFITQTGESFPQWRARLRMGIARRLLQFGEPPSQVGRHVGYASPASFSKAFTKAHGISPRTYQHRETRRLHSNESGGVELPSTVAPPTRPNADVDAIKGSALLP